MLARATLLVMMAFLEHILGTQEVMTLRKLKIFEKMFNVRFAEEELARILE